MPEFRVIDPNAIDFSGAKPAQKTATISARQALEGEQVDTIMKDGHVETTHTAKAGEMVVKNPAGEQYVVEAAKFAKKYEPTGTPGVYAPKGGPVNVLPLDENVEFKAPWGETMKIKAGGVLVHNGPGDVYGIQPEEFRETYSYLDAAGKPIAQGASTAGSSAAKSAGVVENAAVLNKAARIAGKFALPVAVAAGAAETAYDLYKGDHKGATEAARAHGGRDCRWHNRSRGRGCCGSGGWQCCACSWNRRRSRCR